MRRVDTLRVSVTDRCNLRCIYCMPPEGVRLIPHDQVFSFEEIERVARIAAGEGVKKVRITGGEPLVRKGIVELVSRLSKIQEISDLPMTTNGVLLSEFAKDLKRAGLSRLTVSMDTLRPERFETITKRPWLDMVLSGIDAANDAGFPPVKVNVVVVPHQNDDEVLDFVALARERGLEVRFIERMPIIDRSLSPHCGPASDTYIPSAKLLERIEAGFGKLEPLTRPEQGQAAKVYALPGGRGKVGFITPMSEPFCKWCKRMRLTPDGRLRACLTRELEIDVKGPLRSGASDADIRDLYQKAVDMKPRQDAACFSPTNRGMSQIGG